MLKLWKPQGPSTTLAIKSLSRRDMSTKFSTSAQANHRLQAVLAHSNRYACGCTVGGERKTKKLASGEIREYVYYSCSNAKRICKRTVIRQEEVERQIIALFSTFSIPELLLSFGMDSLLEWKTQQNQQREEEKTQMAKALTNLNRKQDRLLDMRMNELLTDSEYSEQKKRIQANILQTQAEVERLHTETANLWENFENLLTMMEFGAVYFEGGEPFMQHLIAKTIGAHYILTDGCLMIELTPVFARVAELKNEVENGSDKAKRGSLGEERLVWLTLRDVIRTEMKASGLGIPNITSLTFTNLL